MPSNAMLPSASRQLQTERGVAVKVSGWRRVCVLYSLFCVLVLQHVSEGAKARCGRELVADLEFVCGERGFYRGKPGGPRAGGPRSRGKGIVEQCCVRGCDLQHLESYCAKPKRGRRRAPALLQQTGEEQFMQVFQRRYQMHSGMYMEATPQRLREQILYLWSIRSSTSQNSDTKTPNRPPSAHPHQNTSIPTFIPQNKPL